jgi:hypothetical protein
MTHPNISRNTKVASQPSTMETLEMQKCTCKRPSKDSYKDQDSMDKRKKALDHEVQTTLTRKDEAYLR